MSSEELADYIDDIARRMGIDLNEANDEETAKILSEIPSSLSDEIVNMRNKKRTEIE